MKITVSVNFSVHHLNKIVETKHIRDIKKFAQKIQWSSCLIFDKIFLKRKCNLATYKKHNSKKRTKSRVRTELNKNKNY